MKTLILTILIGCVAGAIDVMPMVKMKLDRYSIVSAFMHFVIAALIIFNTDLFHMVWWLKGSVITLLLAVPVIILVAKDDKKSAIPMGIMSVVLGALMGIAGHLIL